MGSTELEFQRTLVSSWNEWRPTTHLVWDAWLEQVPCLSAKLLRWFITIKCFKVKVSISLYRLKEALLSSVYGKNNPAVKRVIL